MKVRTHKRQDKGGDKAHEQHKKLQIPNYNTNMTEETLKNGRCMKKTKRRLVVGRHQLFALKAVNVGVTNNMWEAVRVAENFTPNCTAIRVGMKIVRNIFP